jgi:site-specific recombinase XerD
MAHGGAVMRTVRAAADRYLEVRRNLGFDLTPHGRLLRRFAEFAERNRANFVTTDLVLRWADTFRGVLPSTVAFAVSVVRRFAVWQAGFEPRTQPPPAGLIPGRYQRRRPFIHSDEQVVALVSTAARISSTKGLRGPTYSTFFGLLAATGLRMSEAVNLDQGDVNLADGILMIRRAKFGKSRLIPLHPTTRRALEQYAKHRDDILGHRGAPAFFVSEAGRRITEWSARYQFAQLSQRLGHRPSNRHLARRHRYRHGRGPRLHDLRHRFAALTLLDWYRAGVDVEREIPKLVTYLGHVKIEETYWYIEAVPELLHLATDRVAIGWKREAVAS